MKKRTVYSLTRQNSGFSVLELAIAMVFLGLVLSSFLSFYMIDIKKLKISETKARMSVYSSSIELFFKENGFYPCPAHPKLDPEDDEYGKMACPVLAMGDCHVDGICRVSGARDTDSDGDVEEDSVLIGVVPFKSLNMQLNVSSNDVVDGWGNHFGYVISQKLTNGATYDDEHGVIQTLKFHNPLLTQENNSKGIIISYGPDGMGAHNSNGNLIRACEAGHPDSENCDANSDFLFFSASNEAESRAVTGNIEHYDDFIEYKFTDQTARWTQSSVDADDMYSQNIGNVGIGVVDPQEKIHVDGNIRTENMSTINFCDENGADCFSANMIADVDAMDCGEIAGDEQAMTGVAGGTADCGTFFLPAGINAASSCGANEYVAGIDATGNFICQPSF